MDWGSANAPKISIVVPSLNQGRFIGATLQSIVDQAYPNLELIVVDGGSTDDSFSIIQKFESHITWWVSEPDQGQAAAINKGFRKATGEIMAWINSDDLMMPGALHHIADFFSKQPDAQVVYGNRILIDECGQEIGRWILPVHSNNVLLWEDYIPQETLYWRRGAWNAIGSQLDESFRFAMDWDLLLRFFRARVKIERLPFFLGLFRIHPLQKTSSQMASIGKEEMQRLHCRELGFIPTRWQRIMRTAPYLLAAKLHELSFKLGLNRNSKT